MKCEICGAPGGDLWTIDRHVCPACLDLPRFRYGYLIHPPMIGTQPDGWINRRSFFPGKEHIDGLNVPVWGWVEYVQPLATETAWHFDLMPLQKDEQRAYIAYQRRYGG